jgi:hypothetical protein
MNRDDIVRWAREAGFEADESVCDVWATDGYWAEELERFAALVAAAEREACAEVVENCCSYCAERIRERDGKPREPVQCNISIEDITKIALKIFEAETAIRARGEEPKRHPGYIMGDHWLQAAYTRICTGETEAEVMADYGWQRESR